MKFIESELLIEIERKYDKRFIEISVNLTCLLEATRKDQKCTAYEIKKQCSYRFNVRDKQERNDLIYMKMYYYFLHYFTNYYESMICHSDYFSTRK